MKWAHSAVISGDGHDIKHIKFKTLTKSQSTVTVEEYLKPRAAFVL